MAQIHIKEHLSSNLCKADIEDQRRPATKLLIIFIINSYVISLHAPICVVDEGFFFIRKRPEIINIAAV